jgi:hypothetical protein
MSNKRHTVLGSVFIMAFCMSTIGIAVAGERAKSRAHNHITKWDQIEIGDEEGHVVALYEGAGSVSFLQWKGSSDVAARDERGLLDFNTKTGSGSGYGYGIDTDKDGDKMFWTWKGKPMGDGWSGEMKYVKGTGKYEGIKGNGTFFSVFVDEKHWIINWEGEIEIP